MASSAATTATGLANATLPRFLSGSGGLGPGGYGFGIAALATGLMLGETVIGLMPVRPEGGRRIVLCPFHNRGPTFGHDLGP